MGEFKYVLRNYMLAQGFLKYFVEQNLDDWKKKYTRLYILYINSGALVLVDMEGKKWWKENCVESFLEIRRKS